MNDLRKKARDTKRIADLKQIQVAIELYNDDNGYYPREANGANGKVGEGGGLDTMLSTYIARNPSDPLGPNDSTHYYYYDGYHDCTNKISASYVSVLFARTMEIASNANWSDICNGNGIEGTPGINTYMIVIGYSNG